MHSFAAPAGDLLQVRCVNLQIAAAVVWGSHLIAHDQVALVGKRRQQRGHRREVVRIQDRLLQSATLCGSDGIMVLSACRAAELRR